MSQSLLHTSGHTQTRCRPQSLATASTGRPEADRVLRDVAFVCRLTERVKEAVVGGKRALAGAAV